MASNSGIEAVDAAIEARYEVGQKLGKRPNLSPKSARVCLNSIQSQSKIFRLFNKDFNPSASAIGIGDPAIGPSAHRRRNPSASAIGHRPIGSF